MLDLSDILTDPDLAGQPFTIRRRSRTVGEDGRAVTSELFPVDAQGSVQPAPGKMLERLPEEDRQREVVVIYTTAPLTQGGPGIPPDMVESEGSLYTVRNVKRYTQFGAPHYEALAVLLPLEGAAVDEMP